MATSLPVEGSPARRPRRHRLRFGLRAGIVAVAVVGVLLGLLDYWYRAPDRAQERAAVELTRLGGSILLIDEPPGWLRRNLGFSLLDRRVAAVVDLGHSRVTDADMVQVQALRRFGRLELRDTEVGDAGLEQLRGRDGIGYLDLSRTRVTNAACLFGDGSHTPLVLKLAGNRLARGPILYSGPRQSWCYLQELDLSDTDADDGTLAALPHGLMMLNTLKLKGTRVGDDGLDSLLRMDETRGLNPKFPGLRALDLRGTRVTAGGVARLQATWRGNWPLSVATDPFPPPAKR